MSRRILNPPGIVFHAIVVALAIVMIAGAWLEQWLPGRALFVIGVIVFATWLVIAAIWLLSAIVAFRSHVRGFQWLRWTMSPLVVFILLAGFMPVFHLQFWLSRPALERWALQVATAPPGASVPEPYWSFIEVNKPHALPGGAYFYTLVGGHWLDTQGLAYSSQKLPQDVNVNGRHYKPWCGNWYTFWEP